MTMIHTRKPQAICNIISHRSQLTQSQQELQASKIRSEHLIAQVNAMNSQYQKQMNGSAHQVCQDYVLNNPN